jgi:hypothetical protein
MSDAQWGDEELPQKKKSIPTWVWFCSGGCLLMVLVLVVGAIFTTKFVSDMVDPEVQWPKLDELLPFDERPPELTMTAGFSMLGQQSQFTLMDNRGFMAQFQMVAGSQGASMRQQMFDNEEPKLVGNFGVIDFKNVQKGTVNVQGRDLRIVRMEMGLGDMMKSIPGVDDEDVDESAGHAAYIDLTPEDDSGMMWLQYTRRGSGETITDGEIQTFFEPFHVGPDR